MKLATAYYGFREQTPINYFEMAAALGIQFVEIPMYAHIIKDKHYNLRSVDAIDAVRQMALDSGVQIVASVSNLPIAPRLNLWGGSLDESTITFGMAAARRVIDIASQLGIGIARITEPNVAPEDIPRASSLLEECGKALRKLAPQAEAAGVQLVVENYGITAEQLLIVLESADHSSVGALYDPCNFQRIGEDPLQALRHIRRYVNYVHLKDTRRDDARDPNALFEGSRWSPSVAVGHGDIDWYSILHELTSFYDGYLSIEYEMPADVMRGTRTSLETIQAVVSQMKRSQEETQDA